MKFISFIITIGGDVGWRFTNGPELCSVECQLLFDKSSWTCEKIKELMSELYDSCNDPYDHTLIDIWKTGDKVITPIIGTKKDIYINKEFVDSENYKRYFRFNLDENGKDKDKFISPEPESIESWVDVDGGTRCHHYQGLIDSFLSLWMCGQQRIKTL